ncbi:MAG: DUF1697 domain-containing protein [Ignavibacteriales bacterium]|nr:DUF1697 domain-containing protein [Ignavibacteriales bacterium]
MPTFLSILRGINVSGQKKIQMKDLQTLYEELKFKNVRTYIQSGNVVFESSSKSNLSNLIEQKISERYKFSVPVIILSEKEMQAVVKNNPFIKEENIDVERLYVAFCTETPQQELQDRLAASNFEPERFSIIGKNVYLCCPNGFGRAKLNNNFLESKLKLTATTRNWKTVNALLNMMQVK